MGLGPFGNPAGGNASIAESIYRLLNNPFTKKLIPTAQKYGSGPLVLPSSSRNSNTYKARGATARNTFGQLGEIGKIGQGIQNTLNPDPMMSLYAKLLDQLQAPVNMPTGIDTDNLMNQVKAAINPIYDARASAAKDETGQATAQVKNMYRALSNDYERLAPEQTKQAKVAQKGIEDLYGQLRSNIEGTYSRVSKEQGDLFKSLGIEAALPDVLDKQEAPVQEALTSASENQAQQEQRYADMGNVDATYYREGSPNATMTGNEISTDLIGQLGNYLKQIESERSSGIQSGYLDQLGQAQNQLAQQQQSAQSESARRQEMLWSMLQGQMNSQSQQQQITPDSFMAQLPEPIQQSVAGAFTQLQRSPEAVYGKVEDKRNPVPGSFVETTPEWYMQQADTMLQNGQIDPATHQALLMYLQLNFKMGG